MAYDYAGYGDYSDAYYDPFVYQGVNNNSNYSYGNYSNFGNNYEYVDYKNKFFYSTYPFEKVVYLYVWAICIFLTTFANILVILVLTRRRMRNATNVILVAIAISDSLTGLVTLPPYIYFFSHYKTTEDGSGMVMVPGQWCEAFMLIKYFVSRSFHTVSIWLTVALAVQRLVSVYIPFKASTMFSIRRTLIMICVVLLLSPILHIYHVTNDKTSEHHECHWKLESNCTGGGCAYLWLVALVMHFIPCILLISLSVAMVVVMTKATAKMKRSRMISSAHKLHKRDLESRRISLIVIAVVIVFLIPEVPYGLFLFVNVIKYHSSEVLIAVKTNRLLICVYEILVVLSFHANFWIYLAMNRRFRRGLTVLFESMVVFVCALGGKFGLKYHYQRRCSESSTDTARVPQTESYTQQTAISRSNSNAKDVILNRRASRASSIGLEMKTYQFDNDKDRRLN